MSTQSKDTFGIDDARNIEHMIKVLILIYIVQ